MKKDGAAVRKGKKEKHGIRASEQIELMLMMLPTFALIFVFCYIPMYGIVIAFQNYVPGRPFLAFDGSVEWVGLKHFVEFIQTRTFSRLIRNTLVLSGLNLVFGFTLPIIFALVLNELRSGFFKKFIQTSSYLPYFISTVVVAGMVLSFLDTNGPLNAIRRSLGLNPVNLIVDAKAFPAIYTITNVWKSFGWDSILYLSAMSSVDQNLYEAARLDGASRLQQMRYITIPSIRPTIMLLLILAIGGILSSNTDLILLLYNPATYETADVVGTYIYRDSLLGGRYSFGTAAGLFTSALNFTLVYIANAISRKVADFSLW